MRLLPCGRLKTGGRSRFLLFGQAEIGWYVWLYAGGRLTVVASKWIALHARTHHLREPEGSVLGSIFFYFIFFSETLPKSQKYELGHF
jgi:hypothetical protein